MKNIKTKELKSLLLFLILFCVIESAIAQTSIGIKFNAGTSWLAQGRNAENIVYKTKLKPAYSFGVYAKYMIGKNTLLGVDLLYSNMTAHDVNEDYLYSFSSLEEFVFDVQNKFKFSYINLPVYYGVLWKKWEFDIGINLLYRLKSQGNYTLQAYWDEEPYGDNLNVEADNFNLGFFFGVNYLINNRIAVSLNYSNSLFRSYYYSLFDETSFFPWRERLLGMLTLGVNCNLVEPGKKE